MDKVESEQGEARPFRYSRTNLLDVYRVADMHTSRKLVEFVQVPSVTQDEPLEPLALCSPNSEELVIDVTVYFVLDATAISSGLLDCFSV